MPRTLGSGMLVVPKLGKAEAVYLLEFQFSGATVRLNTGAVDLSWNGFTWVAVGGAIEIEPVAETSDERGQSIGVKLSGVDQDLIAVLLSQGHKGRLAKVWLAHLHAGTNMVLNPEVQTVSTGWSHLNSTFATGSRDTVVRAPGGGPSFKMTVTNTGSANGQVGIIIRNGGLGAGNRILAKENVPYTWSLSMDLSQYVGLGYQFRLRMVPFDAADAQLPGTMNGPTITPELGWRRYSMTAIPQAGTAKVDIRFDNITAGVPLGDFWLSEAKLEPGAIDGEYLPGFDQVITRGAVVIDPIPFNSYYMNEGFKIEEQRDDLGAGGTVTISTRLVSRLAVLAKIRGLRTNVDSHQSLFAGDNFFKFVPTLTHKRIKWGG